MKGGEEGSVSEGGVGRRAREAQLWLHRETGIVATYPPRFGPPLSNNFYHFTVWRSNLLLRILPPAEV